MTNFTSSIPLYYHYGLERTDQFGAPLFLEAVRRHPWAMADRIWVRLRTSVLSLTDMQAVPTRDRPLGSTFGARQPSGLIRLAPPDDLFSPFFAPYYSPALTVWERGMDAVAAVLWLRSSSVLYVCLNLAAIAGLLWMPAVPARAQLRWLTLALLTMAAGSAALIGIRSKEVVAMTPLLCVVWGGGLSACGVAAMNAARRWRRRSAGDPAPRDGEGSKPSTGARQFPESIGPVER